MRIGDVVINPKEKQELTTKPNPKYKSMVIHIGTEYTTCLRYDGKLTRYYTKDVKDWKVSHNVSLWDIIMYDDETRERIKKAFDEMFGESEK